MCSSGPLLYLPILDLHQWVLCNKLNSFSKSWDLVDADR